MREFGIIQDTFPGSTDFYKDWADASITNLSNEQREKLFTMLYPQPQQATASIDTQEIDHTTHITIDGDITDVWEQLPEKQRLDIEYGIQHVLSEGRKGDLVLGRRAKIHTGGWEKTVGDATFLEKYNLQTKAIDKPISGSSNILLVLRVSPTGSNTANISAELLEIPTSGKDGGRMAMIMSGMAFHKTLNGEEFLAEFANHKKDLSLAT